jgi:predicted molibdopterin-dependent oxidoreductase YjgC
MSEEMVKFKIDGQELEVPKGTTILEAAKSAGIRIPTFCYHERLTPIGSCRMCMVEIDGFDHPVPACMTPADNEIEVITNSELLYEMRRNALKLILLNHPLDCPICDKAGECTLQDLVYEFNIEQVEFQEKLPEKGKPEYATPFIKQWTDRCVMCLRCITACREITGNRAIDIVGQGWDAKVTVVKPELCKSCGECLFVCPTGSLTDKLTSVKGRQWFIERVKTTCTYCGCGCQMDLNVFDGKIIKVTTEENIGPNKGSLCVKGKYGWDFIYSEDRLTKPLIKRNGEFQEASWDEAIDYVAKRLKEIKKKNGSDAIFGLTSARATNEENYIFQKFFRSVIGTNNIDHCARL